MPFKSRSQISKFAQMVKDGLLDKSTFDEWMSKTKNPKKLPERVGHKPSKVQKVKVIK